MEIECPECKTKLEFTKEEIFKEKYIFCWFCSESFRNINYNGN